MYLNLKEHGFSKVNERWKSKTKAPNSRDQKVSPLPHPNSPVLVLYYSTYGHMHEMACSVVEGIKEGGGNAFLKRVPELLTPEVLQKMKATECNKKQDDVPVCLVSELPDYDAIIFGTPTRFGNMAFQMKAFLDQTGGLWDKGALTGKVASIFTGSSYQHGGQESTILTMMVPLLHHGMVLCGLPSECLKKHCFGNDSVKGGSFYGASCIVGDGSKPVTNQEKAVAQFQGKHVTQLAAKLCK